VAKLEQFNKFTGGYQNDHRTHEGSSSVQLRRSCEVETFRIRVRVRVRVETFSIATESNPREGTPDGQAIGARGWLSVNPNNIVKPKIAP
jgi:hypothetical protein